MFKFFKSINPLIAGIFLLIWANDAYFLFGNTGKFAALISGFILVLLSAARNKINRSDVKFFMITSSFYILYLTIASFQNQNTLNSQNLIFGLICYILLNAGYIISKNQVENVTITNKLIFAYSILSLLGGYAFYIKQTQIFQIAISARDLGDESLNPIGVAYTHSLLLLFLFWLFYQTLNKKIRVLIILSIAGMAMVIVSTLSRGAVIYLAFLMLLLFTKRTKLTRTVLKKRINLILVSVFFIILFFSISSYIPLLESKIESLSDRFLSLFDFLSNRKLDRSANERKTVYLDFFENWIQYFLGKEGYTPYPHNQFLEILMRWGVFGIPLIVFSLRLFIKSFKMINLTSLINKPVLFLVLLLFFFSYLQSMSSMSLEMNRMLWFGFGYLLRKPIN